MSILSLSLAIATIAGTGAAALAQTDKSGSGNASRMAGAELNQTFTGVLVDGNCSSMKSAAGTTGVAVGIQDSSGVARPGAPGPGGAAADPIPEAGPVAERRAGIGRTGAGRDAGRPGDEAAAGGVRVDADPGDRSNVTAGTSALPPELRNCAANSNTDAYALYSDGRVFHLDSESKGRIRQQLQDQSQNADRTRTGAAAEPMLVRVQGRVKLHVTSIEPVRSGQR